MPTHRQGAHLDEAVERTLLEAAVAAPSIHNSQPWQFLVGSRRIELYADPARHLRVSDGSGRSLLISCGAALFNLRVAAEHLGLHPRVRLMASEDPTLVAVVDIDHRHTRSGLLDELYPAIWLRHTNRHPFWGRTPSPATLSRLVEAVTQENAVLRIYDDPNEVGRIVDLLHRAEVEERKNRDGMAERAAWVTSEPARRRHTSRVTRSPARADRRRLPRSRRGREAAAPYCSLRGDAHRRCPLDDPRHGTRLGARRPGSAAGAARRDQRGSRRVVHEPAARAGRPALAGAFTADRARPRADAHAHRLRRPSAANAAPADRGGVRVGWSRALAHPLARPLEAQLRSTTSLSPPRRHLTSRDAQSSRCTTATGIDARCRTPWLTEPRTMPRSTL